MKKFTVRKMIAIVLVVMQLACLCAIGASAAETPNTIYRTDPSTMKLDGQVSLGEYWGELSMQIPEKAADTSVEGVKWMWGSDSNGTYVYFFFTFIDSNSKFDTGAQGWDGDGFIVGIDETGANSDDETTGYKNTDDLHRCATQLTKASTAVTTVDWLSYFIVRSGNLVNIEGRIKIKGETNVTSGKSVGLNIMGQPNNGEKYDRVILNGINPSDRPGLYVKYTLSETYAERVNVRYDLSDPVVFYSNNKPIMTKTFKDGSDNEIELPTVMLGQTVAGWRDRADSTKVYAPGSTVTHSGTQLAYDAILAAPMTQAGAAVYMLDPNKIGFTMEVYGYKDAKNSFSEMGILTMEADTLTDEVMASKMTREALDEAGVAYTEHKASAVAEKYRAEIPVTQYDVRYAAVSYITIKYTDNTTQTFYSDFNKVSNIRSARDVAAAAYGDRTQVKVENYTFKQGKTYGCLGFEVFSYSPYANVELKVLKVIGGLS